MKTDLQAKRTAREETSLSVNEVSAKEQNQIIIYHPNDTISLEVRLENDTVWLSQTQIAELFERDRTVIGKHIKNCYKEGELDQNITCAKFAHMGIEGDQTYEYTMYNLDVIILQRHNRQYSPINIHNHTTSHDRFLIIDDTEVYHIGASLKDLGKKLFAFSKLNIPPSAIL